jgi:hypothetical protein
MSSKSCILLVVPLKQTFSKSISFMPLPLSITSNPSKPELKNLTSI